jgi:hypothetical protein
LDAVSLIRHEASEAYAWLENIVSDVSPEQARWRPPGTANSIAPTYAHIMIWSDVDLMRHFHGREPLLAGEWGKRLGRNESDPGEFDVGREFDWSELRAYGRAVHDQTLRLVDELRDEELQRSFQMMPKELGVWKGIDVYLLHGSMHVRMHGGELACLKGLQGGDGYPPRPGRLQLFG